MKKLIISLIIAGTVCSAWAQTVPGRINYSTDAINNLLAQISTIVSGDGLSATNFYFTTDSSTNLLTWNDDEMTLDIVQNGTTLQVGQEMQYHVINNTGSVITDGTVVMLDGTSGASGKLYCKPADVVVADDAKFVMGLATEDFAIGQHGNVTSFGKVRDINTLAFAEGAQLYVGPSGSLTATPPAIAIPIAVVVRSHATTGILMVRAGGGGADVSQDVIDLQATVEFTANKDSNGGYAGLDENGKINTNAIPFIVVVFSGDSYVQ
jgi:hypothetical protein